MVLTIASLAFAASAHATPTAPKNLASSPASPGNTPLPTIKGTADAGTDVSVYHSSNCTGVPDATNTAASFASSGFVVAVSVDQPTTFTANATDGTGTSPCSQPFTYVEDQTPPAAPTGLGLLPGILGNINIPLVLGTAEAGSTVRLYTTSNCTGLLAATNSASAFSVGLTVTVPDNSTTTFYATATDAAGNVSPCSSGITYTEDATPPSKPASLSATPASPANNNSPAIKGTVDAGTTVRLYTTANCTGTVAATGTAAAFASPGLNVAVPGDTTTQITATSTEAAGNISPCSDALAYVEDSTAPAAPSSLTLAPASPANNNAPKLSGTAEAGSSVKLYTTSGCTGGAAVTGSAAAFASPGLSLSVADDSTTTFRATATDAAGNTSACSTGATYVEDSSAPTAPTGLSMSPASPANNNSPKVTGTAEAGSTVKVYTTSDCSGTPVTGSASAFASPGLTVSVSDNTTTTYRATATDAAGNMSACSAGVTYVEDSAAPAQPTLTATPASPSNDDTPALTGSAEAGSTVKLYTTSNCTGTVATSGTAATFASPGLTIPLTHDATTQLTVTATDAAGNVSACSTALAFVEDSTDPAAPSSLATTPGSPANSNSPKVSGTAEAGSTVKLYATSDCSGTPLTTGGAATFASPGLATTVADDSSSTFHVTATDAAGNTSACSSGATYVEDSTPPNAPSGLDPSPASPANNNAPKITGDAEAGATIKVYASGNCSGVAAATGGASAFASPGLAVSVSNDTSTSYSATATDPAGNVSPCSSAITYIEDSTAPVAPSSLATAPASPANDSSPNVTGTAEGGSTVKIYSTTNCSGAIAATGSSAAFASPGLAVSVSDDATAHLSATATDAAGNTSACSSSLSYVEDSTAPAAPAALSVSPSTRANNNAPKVSGTAEPGATVKLYPTSDCSGTALATGSAAAFGTPGLAVSVADDTTTTISAAATDAAGNTSTCSTGVTYVEDSSSPTPTSLTTTPASPANNNAPKISGTAESGSTVRLYTASDCSGTALATGSAATFASPGITIAVADDSRSTVYVRATDALGNLSPCSAGIAYVEDSTAPVAPTGLIASPSSPANVNAPVIGGTAEAGATVNLYATSDCSGTPLATGTAVALGAGGLAVSVGDDTTTTVRATATDAAGNTSPCSDGLTYVEDSTAPAVTLAGPGAFTADTAPQLSGFAGIGTRDSDAVTVRIYAGTAALGDPVATLSTTRDAATGAFVIRPAAPLAYGTYTARAAQSDAAGNVGASTTVLFAIFAPQTSLPVIPPVSPPPAPKPAVVSLSLGTGKVSKGRVRLTISCLGAAGQKCAGRVQLRSKSKKSKKGSPAFASRPVAYSVVAGKRKTVLVKLPAAALRAVRAHRRLKIVASFGPSPTTATSKTIMLRS